MSSKKGKPSRDVTRLNYNRFTAKNRKIFLEKLYWNGGNITRTLDMMGISRTAYYKYIKTDKETNQEFLKQVDEVVERSVDVLIHEANRRAVRGVPTPVYHKGQLVGHTQKYSDSLLMFLIKGYDKRFVDRREISGPDGGPIPAHVVASKLDLSRLTTEELKQLKSLSKKLLTAPEEETTE